MNKKIIILIISILVLGGVSIFFIWDNVKLNFNPHTAILNEKYSEGQVKKFILSYVKDYKIENKGDTIQVTINAPDFRHFFDDLPETENNSASDYNELTGEEKEKLMIEDIKQVFKNYDIKKKDYIFSVENTKQETIEEVFLDNVVYDISLSIFDNINVDKLKKAMDNDAWENME